MEKNKKISFWDKVGFWLSAKEAVKSFEVCLNIKTGTSMVLGRKTQKLIVDSDTVVEYGYVSSGDFKTWDAVAKIKENVSGRTNARAKELLETVRKGRGVVLNNSGAWVEGKHIVAVDWEIENIEWRPLELEEYIKIRELKKNKGNSQKKKDDKIKL